MKNTAFLYKDIKGNRIKRLDVFVNSETLLLGIHVKYIVFILFLLILYLLGNTNIFCLQPFFHALGCQCTSDMVCHKDRECFCIEFDRNVKIVIIAVALVVCCIIKWMRACQIKQIVTACFPAFTKLEIYIYHKRKLEKLYEKKRELELEKAEAEFYRNGLKKEIDELHENDMQGKVQKKELSDKLNSYCLKTALLDKRLVVLSSVIEQTKEMMREHRYKSDSYKTDIENAISTCGCNQKRCMVRDSDKSRIRILFKSLETQLLYPEE